MAEPHGGESLLFAQRSSHRCSTLTAAATAARHIFYVLVIISDEWRHSQEEEE